MVSRSLITRVGILVLLMALLPSAHLFARKPRFDERALAAPVMPSDDEPVLPVIGDPPLPDALPPEEALPVPVGDTHSIAAEELSQRVFMPLIMRPIPPLPDDWLGRVNGYRLRAGVPPVTEDATLNNNCQQHARYMAENNHLTHDQNPSLPYASPEGQICAQMGNAWMGWGTSWQPRDAIDGWMESVGHRLWLLYPTTPTFGFGFYKNAQRSASGLDVLSRTRFNNDAAYSGWPVRYPAPGQTDVPPTRYPITLVWPYFDQKPVLTGATLRALPGTPLAHNATTDLPVGHRGIAITPVQALPANATIEVTVSGTYKGQPFTFTWQFRTRGG